jgi:hypothetical protein
MFEKYKPPFCHTTGVIVITGMIISFTLYKIKNSNNEEAEKDGSLVLEDFSFN